ncbi:MAG: betaine--homocysteine S-methyltransferase [Actinomycetota bacterium]|nr:betaine--homocysteine S-methyltransferase [Actinomycetota bacterium]
MNALDALLAKNGYLVADGAMGTLLFGTGLPVGDAPERWNLDEPENITGVHRSFIAAGSDIVLTNSFGGTRLRLRLHGLDDRVAEINMAAVANARRAADEVNRSVLVAGSIGPSGELLEPLGPLTVSEAEDAFAEQAAALARGGADMLWFETMSALPEVEAGIRAARRATDLPVVAAMSYDTAGHTMMGVTGREAGARLAELDIAAIGANCGANLADTERALAGILDACGEIPVVSKANAGIPVWKETELSFDGTPEVLAAHAHRIREAGVSIIGACCGSTPAHIDLITRVLAGELPVPDVPLPLSDTPNRKNRQSRASRLRRH